MKDTEVINYFLNLKWKEGNVIKKVKPSIAISETGEITVAICLFDGRYDMKFFEEVKRIIERNFIIKSDFGSGLTLIIESQELGENTETDTSN